MKITKRQLKQIIKEEISKVLDKVPNNTPDADTFRTWPTITSKNITEAEDNSDDEKESDSRELAPEEGLDAAEHAIEIIDALKDLISDMMDSDEEKEE